MIAIVDYGVGNLFSLRSSLKSVGMEAVVTTDEKVLHEAEKILLPGVGAFGDAADKLRETGMRDAVLREVREGKPLLGICLGMQLLYDRSYEFGVHEGLGLIPGEVIPMEGKLPSELKIPQIGWNALHYKKESPLFKYVKEGDCVYFVHSFYVPGENEYTLADTEYSVPMTAASAKGRVYGCQFHPEKSGRVGLSILRAFCELTEKEMDEC